MSQIPTRDSLTEALRAIPRESASEDFTARLLSRLDDSQRTRISRLLPLRPLLAAGAAIFLFAIGLTVLTNQRESAHRSAQTNLLRERHRVLSAELSQIQSTTSGAVPVMYVGGSDDVDFFMDARPLVIAQPGIGLSGASPANEVY